MRRVRLIARLDIKGEKLIKGINLEGVRPIGDPHEFAKRYYDQGADELLYVDAVASLYDRNSLKDLIRKATSEVFIPITVGGGIRTFEDAKEILRSGADKIAINSAAIQTPALITQLAENFGAQCVVVSIEAKDRGEGKWEALYFCGRERSHLDVVEWAKEVERLGAGEILLTSVDREGTKTGMDKKLLSAVTRAVQIPVIGSGGMGKPSHLVEAVTEGGVDAIAIANLLHYGKNQFSDFRQAADEAGIPVRKPWLPK